MPEAQPSQNHQPSFNLPPISLSAEPEETNDQYLLIVEDDKGRKEIPLGKAMYSIGRDPKSDIRLFSQFVSRRHATLVRRIETTAVPTTGLSMATPKVSLVPMVS
jgi:pSer/pThr/pTyr-binding forkhead associated (FHA) protein